ncbi:uncharacterized protein L201_007961 [Kwoniella dendrophila CBS 6074]|uniref:WD40 repeat-like protein n=1 Tax=Kwoniella dendrophila CBS 6074 TaxID=1295534 RepID=A0AAX4K816_9TREE
MSEKPLTIPFLIDPALPTTSPVPGLPISPSHIASWITPSTNEAGPSRRIALACPDNSVWIDTTPISSRTPKDQLLSPNLPSITTQAASSPTSPLLGSPRRPHNRPTNSRNLSYTGSGITGRHRNSSSASSIYSTASGTGKRRTSAFSPPPSALQLPTTTLSSISASAAAPDKHTHRNSISDHNDLRESLEKHKESKNDNSSSIIGLGIGGIGRRGLTGLHGRDENIQNNTNNDRSGATSPKSIISNSTDGTTTTTTGRFGFFGRNSLSTENESDKEQEKEKIKEFQVDLEMEKESREDQKELEDMKLIENAIERSSTPTITQGDQPLSRTETVNSRMGCIRRIILKDAGKGKIVQLKVFQDLDTLAILRDEGILDLFSLTTLKHLVTVNPEVPEEAKGSGTGSSSKSALRIPLFWQWKNVQLARKDDTCILIAHGLPWPCELPSPNGEVTRVVMISPLSSDNGMEIVARLDLPGEGDVGVCNYLNSCYLLHSTSTSFMSYPINFPSQPPSKNPTPIMKASPQIRAVSSAVPSNYARSSTPDPAHVRTRELSREQPSLRKSASYTHLKESASTPLLEHSKEEKEKEKGFAKFLARRDWVSKKAKEEDKPEELSPGIGEGKEVERDGGGGWTNILVHENGEAVGWKDDAVDIFWIDGKQMQMRGTITLPAKGQVRQVLFTHGWKSVNVFVQKQLDVFSLRKNNKDRASNLQFEKTVTINDVTSIAINSEDETVTMVTKQDIKELDLSRRPSEAQQILQLKQAAQKNDIAHIAATSVESVYVTDPRGNVSSRQFGDLLVNNANCSTNNDDPTVDRLDARVTTLTIIIDNSTEYLVAGDEDGAVRIWTTSSFKLCGSFTLFADPVKDIALLDMTEAGPLRGCLLVISNDGTVGIISLKEMDDLFLIPASRTPLRRVFIEQKDILLAYANGKARVWNTQTQEFRRSTGLDAAEDMLQVGDWAEVLFGQNTIGSVFSSLSISQSETNETGRLLNFNLRELSRWLHSSKNNPNHSPLTALRNLLSVFLTFGIDHIIDRICTDNLGIHKSQVPLVIGQSDSGVSQFSYYEGADVWRISSKMTGLRQLAVVTLLRPFLDSPDHERWAAEVIAHYTASLPLTAIEPDLRFFAEYYMDSSTDIHQAARMLFAARVGRMDSKDIETIMEVGHHDLPNKLPTSDKYCDTAVNALTMLGGIALHKFETMQSNVLKSIAESIAIFLQSNSFSLLSLAIELCSKGFATWQSYIDPSELLRRLFYLSTNKEFSSSSNSGYGGTTSIAAQSRLAVLHVASLNPALFMSTLSMDILDAKSVENRTSIMKLCVFISRKKPNLLENGLPKIAEAIVKSLDPNIGKMRDDVWQAATVILNELVLAFSTIDFHSGTQRLAVGTHEGAVIMYDLKTASRLYVIEPHKHPVSAVTLSPDGRRLITVSLEEGNVTVWKVGSSLSGFFNVGAPPRQGGEKGEPFKRIEFIRADDGPLNSTSALSDIQISWPGNRQARVLIKETALTFET